MVPFKGNQSPVGRQTNADQSQHRVRRITVQRQLGGRGVRLGRGHRGEALARFSGGTHGVANTLGSPPALGRRSGRQGWPLRRVQFEPE